MKKRMILAAGAIAALVLVGCQNQQSQTQTNVSETEKLKEQIAQLEQQITELKQQNNPTETGMQEGTVQEGAVQDTENQQETPDGQTYDHEPYTIEELTRMVEEYVARVNEAQPTGTDEENMIQFFELKSEGKRIEDELDYYEDELERLYREGSLTREEYRAKEREAELLEDALDQAENTLEYAFGIDD